MLRKLLANIYHRLPLLRETHSLVCQLHAVNYQLDALIREHRETRATLLLLENNLKASQMIQLHDFDLRAHQRYAEPKRLLRYQAQVSSQNGEDGVIHEIFRRIGTTTRIFAEVGIGDGYENNTAFLLAQGWTGFWIDADGTFLKALEKREDLSGDCLRHLVALTSRENICQLFGQLGVPVEFDLMSLDIDQNTYYLWEALRSFRPRVVVIEYNAAIPPDIEWKVRYDANRVWDGSQNFGASLKSFEMLGRELGYSLVGCDFGGTNAFFVRDDLLADKFAGPFTAENHYEPARYPMCHRRCHRPAILDRSV